MPRLYRYRNEIIRELFVESDLEPSGGWERVLAQAQDREQAQAQDREQVAG